ncbi:MAG: hypothetical protein Q9O74_11795 [Planctomycetota bacterium]|nr:hypothetical protein [Planctomycetota bacterium]
MARVVCVLGMLTGSSVPARSAVLPQTSATFTQAEPGDDWRDRSDAYAALVQRAATEPADSRSVSNPEIRGLELPEVSVLTEADPGWADAQLSLEDALDRFVVPSPEWTIALPPPVPAATKVRAQRLYVSGMAKRTAGDNPGAVQDFTAAARLDPGAPAPWLRLAEAQARSGQGPTSLLSRRRAADLGDNDPVSLYILGAHTARLGQHDLAAHYLARCLRQRPSRVDPLLGPVAMVRLGESLRELGLLRASMEALQTGLREMPSVPVRSPFSRTSAEITASATDHWLAVGDTASRLGEDQIAADAYSKAGAHATDGSNAMFLRRAAVFLRRGQAAALAVLVLDEATTHGGFVNTVQRQLLATLRDDDTVASRVAAALKDLADSFPEASPDSIHASLLLARAGVLPLKNARALLLAEGLPYFADSSLLDALFASTEESNRKDLALEILEAEPTSAQQVAAAITRWHPAPASLVQTLGQSQTAVLLRAELHTAAGQAAAVAGTALDTERASPAHLELRGRAAAMAGAWEAVDLAVGALADHRVEQARVLFAAQRFGEGLARLDPELGETASLKTLLLGAELALASGAPERAEELFANAIGLDPFNARAYEGLVNVYQGFGDARRAAGALQLLRNRLPGAWFVRWIAAQDQVRNGMLDEAETTLRELVEAAPDRTAPIDLLSQVWVQRADRDQTDALADAQSWIEEQTNTLPTSAALWALRGRLLTLRGENDQAERVLRDALKARPSVALSRALERLLRETGRQDEADRIARTRFQQAGHGIESSLDYAESLARSERWADILPVLPLTMPEHATLTPRQRARALAIIAALAPQTDGQLSATGQRDLLAILDLAAERGLALPWQLLSLRWTLLATDKTTDDETVVAAARDFLDAIDSLDAVRSMASRTSTPVSLPIQTLDQGRGSIAYLLANSLQSDGRVPAALAMFRLALEYYPDHAWAANDLGYFLVERHENLDEAEQLLEHAYDLMPAQASVADSLAWLRYKTGRFDDQQQPDGTRTPGAASLLKAALGLPGGESNPTIHDHLGDTLWRIGDQERALAEWVRAQQLLFDRLTRLRDGGNSPARDRLTEQATRVGAKVDAVRAGQEPEITPVFENSPTDQ